jgi:hypothetical protein
MPIPLQKPAAAAAPLAHLHASEVASPSLGNWNDRFVHMVNDFFGGSLIAPRTFDALHQTGLHKLILVEQIGPGGTSVSNQTQAPGGKFVSDNTVDKSVVSPSPIHELQYVALRTDDTLVDEQFQFAIPGRLNDHPSLLQDLIPRMEALFAEITPRGTLIEKLGLDRYTLSYIEGANETPTRNATFEVPNTLEVIFSELPQATR